MGKDRSREGVCEIPVRLPMNKGTRETVECMWVYILCMLDLIKGLCHKTPETHFSGMICSTSECIK